MTINPQGDEYINNKNHGKAITNIYNNIYLCVYMAVNRASLHM
jgi:hypothetical protein